MGTAEHRQRAGHDPVTVAIVTVSDTRTPETDENRRYIEGRMRELGHVVAAYRLIKDEPDQVRSALEELAALPDVRIILFNGGTPFMMFGSLAGSFDALAQLEALSPQTIVPGHGSVAGPDLIGRVRSYLEFIRDNAKRGFDAGIEPADLAKDLDLGPFAELTDSERLVPNLHRAYLELRGGERGAPLDLPRMFSEMVAYNGGQPLRCLA